MISAVEKRFALVTSQLDGRSGLTSRERRALHREANILRRWLFPDAKTPGERRRQLQEINNLRLTAAAWLTTRRRPSKRGAREARRAYREERTLQKRPDYTPTPVISVDELDRIGHLSRVKEAKAAWFERKHGREANETAATRAMQDLQSSKLAQQLRS